MKQEGVAAFAYKIELLRKSLAIDVAGVFITKTSHQLGAVKVGKHTGIELVILGEDATPPGFSITFLQYNVEREAKLRNIHLHPHSGRYTLRGFPVTLTHGESSHDAE